MVRFNCCFQQGGIIVRCVFFEWGRGLIHAKRTVTSHKPIETKLKQTFFYCPNREFYDNPLLCELLVFFQFCWPKHCASSLFARVVICCSIIKLLVIICSKQATNIIAFGWSPSQLFNLVLTDESRRRIRKCERSNWSECLVTVFT